MKSLSFVNSAILPFSTKHVWMSRSATPATRNEVTPHVKPPKMTPSAELTIGKAIRPSHERLRPVANGCEHKRNVERTHPQPPDPQSETGTLATHSGLTQKNIASYTITADLKGKKQFPRFFPLAQVCQASIRFRTHSAVCHLEDLAQALMAAVWTTTLLCSLWKCWGKPLDAPACNNRHAIY